MMTLKDAGSIKLMLKGLVMKDLWHWIKYILVISGGRGTIVLISYSDVFQEKPSCFILKLLMEYWV